MFGRSQRDSGMVMERNNRISDAQRLHLLNSSQVQVKIEKSWRLNNLMQAHRKDQSQTDPRHLDGRSVASAAARGRTGGPRPRRSKANWRVKQAVDDLVWALVNSKEFLYRH